LLRISPADGLDLGLVQRRQPLRERGLIVVEHPAYRRGTDTRCARSSATDHDDGGTMVVAAGAARRRSPNLTDAPVISSRSRPHSTT
jgi:hypothetical protein